MVQKRFYRDSISIIASYFTEDAPSWVDHSGIYWLGLPLEHLSRADIAVFLPGWDKTCGCCIKHEVCKQYGIPCLYLRTEEDN